MKTIQTTTLFLLASLLFALERHPLPTATAATPSPSPVLDSDGEEVVVGTKYYILPAIWPSPGGAVTLARTRNSRCAVDVVRAPFHSFSGFPVTFSPANSSEDGIIRVSTDYNFKFSRVPKCARSAVWRLDEVDELTGERFVTTVGEEGNPGEETLSNWFGFEGSGIFYRIYYCPKVCSTCRPSCGDVGVYVETGLARLALSEQGPIYYLQKASSSRAGKKLIIKNPTDREAI